MTLTIERNSNWKGEYLRCRNLSYNMRLDLWLCDIPLWMDNPHDNRWGGYSSSNDISDEDVESIKNYILYNKLLKPVSYTKKLYNRKKLLKAYPLDMLLNYIKRTKTKSRYGEMLIRAVSGT